MPTTVEQRAPVEEQEGSPLPNANPETLNYDESGFGELVERVSSGIEVETEEIVGTAGRRVETAPGSVGLDPESAMSIFHERGFSARIESIVNRMRSLTQQTRDKIEALAGSRTKKTTEGDTQTTKNENLATAEEKQPRAMTLDFYIRLHTPSGTEYAKYASRLAQLRLSGIRRPEKTYGLIRYLEERTTANDWETHTAPTPTQKSALLRGDNPKLIEDLCALPNDPVETLEHLRRLFVSVSANNVLSSRPEAKKLLSIPNIIDVLQKMESAPLVFRIKSGLRDLLRENTESLARLAAEDAQEHFLTEKAMQDLQKLRSLLGFSIDINYAKPWINIAGNDNLLLLLHDSKQWRYDRPFAEYEELMLLARLEKLSASGNAQVMADLLREGFNLGAWDISATSPGVLERIEEITNDPSLKKFIVDVSRLFDIPPKIDELSFQKFKRCFDYPDSLSLVSWLKEIGVLDAGEWQAKNARDWDAILSDQTHMREIMSADFQKYVSTMQRAGGKVHLADLFPTNAYGSGSSFMESYHYHNRDFHSKILSSEDAIILARELNIFQHDFHRYQQFSALLDVPHALEKVRLLQHQFDYKYRNHDGEMDDLVGLVCDDNLMRDLSTEDATKAWQVVQENLGIAFTPNNAPDVIALAHDPSAQERLKDPETSAFIRDVYTQNILKPRLNKIMVLARCDASLRPVIRILRKDFQHEIEIGDSGLYGADAYRRLRDNPKILDVARELKKSARWIDPIRDLALFESLAEFDLADFFIRCEDFPAIKNYFLKNPQIMASIPHSEFPEQLNEILKGVGPIVLCEFIGAFLQQGQFEMIAEIANSKERSAEVSEAVERIKKFIETYNISGKGHTIATLLMMREYREGEDFLPLLLRVEKNLVEYERIIADREPKNIPKGLRASIGMEYEITESTAHAYQKSSAGGDLREDMTKVSQFAGVGRGKDAVFEIATRPTDNPSLMLLEMKLLHDLGFVDFNFNRPDYERGARGYHMTIGGERAIALDSKACFLQNALVISGWGGINAGRNVDGLSPFSNIRERPTYDASRVFENVEPGVEFRALSLDTTEPFERAVATCFYGAIAIQTVDKYAYLQDKDQLADILRDAPSPEQFYEILKDKKLLKETTDDARIKKMIFEWAKLQLGAIRDLTDHNENFLQNEVYGYLNDRGEWVDALDFGGAANRERFLAAVGSEQALKEYGRRSRIDPSELFNTTTALANKCTAITNLFIKASLEGGGDITNATASLDTTKVGNSIEDSDPRAKYSSIFDTHGRTRQGYYYIQGGSEKMLIHAMQKRLLEFNKAMQGIIA